MVKKMKISKIFIGALILICAMGVVCATDITKLQMPENYMNLGDGSYGSEVDDVEIDVFVEDVENSVKNDTSINYTVVPGKIKNTFNFTDGINNETGVLEIVKINNKPAVITFWTETGSNSSDLQRFNDALKEVNKLNKFEPLDPATIDW